MSGAGTLAEALQLAARDEQGCRFNRERLRRVLNATRAAVRGQDMDTRFQRCLAFAWLDAPRRTERGWVNGLIDRYFATPADLRGAA